MPTLVSHVPQVHIVRQVQQNVHHAQQVLINLQQVKLLARIVIADIIKMKRVKLLAKMLTWAVILQIQVIIMLNLPLLNK